MSSNECRIVQHQIPLIALKTKLKAEVGQVFTSSIQSFDYNFIDFRKFFSVATRGCTTGVTPVV